jgi:hypothetical protein
MNLNRYEMKKAWTTLTYYHKIRWRDWIKPWNLSHSGYRLIFEPGSSQIKSRSSTHSILKLGTKNIEFFIDMGEIISITTANQHTAQQNTTHGNAFQQYIHSTLDEMDLTIH